MLVSPPRLLFEEFLDDLKRQGFELGVDHYLRAYRLLDAVTEAPDLGDFRMLLCPLLATTPDQQARFHRTYERYFDTKGSQAGGPRTGGGTVLQRIPDTWKQNPELRRQLIDASRVLIVLLVLATCVLFPWGPTTPRGRDRGNQVASNGATNSPANTPPSNVTGGTGGSTTNSPKPGNGPPVTNPTPDPKPTPPNDPQDDEHGPTAALARQIAKHLPGMENSRQVLRYGLLPAALLFFLFWELYLYLRRRTAASRRHSRRPPLTWPLQIPPSPDRLFTSPDFYAAARLLRQRLVGGDERLDVPGSITATIRAGGYATFRHLPGTIEPEYLVLIERRSPRDHLAGFFAALAAELARQDLAIETHFYDTDPRVCVDARTGARTHLRALQSRLVHSRVFVFAQGETLLDPVTGQLAPWTQLLTEWQDRAVLTPADPTQLGFHRPTLEARLVTEPASVRGLIAAVERFEDPEAPRPAGAVDLRQVPRLESPDQLYRLELYLRDRELLTWLCACAVYPELQWDLTLHLGRILSPKHRKLVTPENLLRLSRLPWFREGYIPDEWREVLIQELGEERERQVREELVKLLLATVPEEGTHAADRRLLDLAVQRWHLKPSFRTRRAVEAALQRMSEEALFSQHALVRLLEDRRLSPLWLQLPAELRRRLFRHGFPALGRNTVVRSAATALVAGVGFLALKPLPVELPPTPPVALRALEIDRTSVVGGEAGVKVTGTVWLTAAATESGAAINLEATEGGRSPRPSRLVSLQPDAANNISELPAGISVQPGRGRARFTLITRAVEVDTPVTLAAVLGRDRATTTLVIQNPDTTLQVAGVDTALEGQQIVGGETGRFTVRFNRPVLNRRTQLSIRFTPNDGTVTLDGGGITPGKSAASYPFRTKAPDRDQKVTITAGLGSSEASTQITVLRQPPLNPLVQRTLEIAAKEDGVREVPLGSNWGPQVQAYLKSTGIDIPAPWCGAFVYWCVEEASKETKLANPVLRTASVQALWQWGRSKGLVETRPEVGDLFIWGSSFPDRPATTTGFVTAVGNNEITVVEGNTNVRGGGEAIGVFERKRRVDGRFRFLRWNRLPTSPRKVYRPPTPWLTDKSFHKALDFTLTWEGRGYVERTAHLVVGTKDGIQQATYDSFRERKGLESRSVREMSDAEMREIYYTSWWVPSVANGTAQPLATVLFDSAVQFGNGSALRMLQRLLGVAADGVAGPAFKARLQGLSPAETVELALKFCDERIADRQRRVDSNPSQRPFLAGWQKRDNALKALVQTFVKADPFNGAERTTNPAGGPIARIEMVNGEGAIRLPSRPKADSLMPGYFLVEGDRISTSPASTAVILFGGPSEGDATFVLNPNSEVELRSTVKGGVEMASYRVLRGSTRKVVGEEIDAPLSLAEFQDRLRKFQFVRKITSVHFHSMSPERAAYDGRNTMELIWGNATGATLSEHVVIAPTGEIWLGRDWNAAPESVKGQNGTLAQGPLSVSVIGNFDRGADPFDGKQREVAAAVVALVQNRFGLPVSSLKFHRDLDKSDTCPGTGIDYRQFTSQDVTRARSQYSFSKAK